MKPSPRREIHDCLPTTAFRLIDLVHRLSCQLHYGNTAVMFRFGT